MFQKFLLLIVGGSIGTTLRYLCYLLMHKNFTTIWGTLIINLIGCAFAGLLWELSNFFKFSNTSQLFIFVGILGAFTTFSTFILDNYQLLQLGKFQLAFLNISLANIVGLISFFLGIQITKLFVK